MRQLTFFSLLVIFIFGCHKNEPTKPQPEDQHPITGNRVAGFRASRILSSYPNHQFPSAEYWQSVADSMAAKFDSTAPGGIWIVSLYQSGGVTRLNFPLMGNYPYITDISEEQNEDYLNYFDAHGTNIWLQVEPGAASVDTLIYLVLNRYKHHPCVVGFGVDVEWYLTNQYSGGKKVSDEEAKRWEAKVKKVNPDYTLFLKHYSASWMPPTYRGDIIFVDDSQNYTGYSRPLDAIVNEFYDWGQRFAPAKVAFQYGYPNDQSWWQNLSDPPGDIGRRLIEVIPNCYGLFWVDFTVTEVFPISTGDNR